MEAINSGGREVRPARVNSTHPLSSTNALGGPAGTDAFVSHLFDVPIVSAKTYADLREEQASQI